MTTTPGSDRRRVLVVWNPSAGVKAGLATNAAGRDDIETLLDRVGLRAELVAPMSEAEARAATRRARDAGCELVVAAGGDGTAGLVASELVGSDTALGILPLGSVMNIARTLGIPRELEPAARVLAAGVPRLIDVGLADGRPFFEAASVGLNAAIFAEAERVDRGDYRAILSMLWVALRHSPAPMRLELDEGPVETRALMVSVANGPYTGLALTIAPDARVDDGRFDVRVFERFSRLELLHHLVSILGGRHRYEPRVATYRSRRVRVESVRPLPCRADAHDLGTTPVTFTLLPQALTVIVPAEARRA